MRIWVTRSQPGAARQGGELRAQGYQVVVEPVLEVVPIQVPEPEGPYQRVLFLSEHAVRCGGTLGYCAGAEVFAVGARTAAVLAEHDIQARTPDQASSEGVLAMLENEPLGGERMLIVAGEDGRKLLRDALQRKGARVCEYLCYRRQARAVDVRRVASVDAVLVGSQDGFRHAARLWFDGGGSNELLVIAASERVASLGEGLGFCNVRVAEGAATTDWIRALEAGRGK